MRGVPRNVHWVGTCPPCFPLLGLQKRGHSPNTQHVPPLPSAGRARSTSSTSISPRPRVHAPQPSSALNPHVENPRQVLGSPVPHHCMYVLRIFQTVFRIKS